MLGDDVARLLESVGVTPERVERWVGRPCGCEERRERLNRFSLWVRRVLSGKREQAREHLESILEQR